MGDSPRGPRGDKLAFPYGKRRSRCRTRACDPAPPRLALLGRARRSSRRASRSSPARPLPCRRVSRRSAPPFSFRPSAASRSRATAPLRQAWRQRRRKTSSLKTAPASFFSSTRTASVTTVRRPRQRANSLPGCAIRRAGASWSRCTSPTASSFSRLSTNCARVTKAQASICGSTGPASRAISASSRISEWT